MDYKVHKNQFHYNRYLFEEQNEFNIGYNYIHFTKDNFILLDNIFLNKGDNWHHINYKYLKINQYRKKFSKNIILMK